MQERSIAWGRLCSCLSLWPQNGERGAKSPWQQRGGKIELALHVINFFGFQFCSQMGNKLNQQTVIKKWSLVHCKKHIYIYISPKNKVYLHLGAWQQRWVCQGRKQHLSCGILGSSLSQEMPSWPAADKIKSSKEGCRVFMRNQLFT